MELINFPGLNCYTNSMVSIAHAYGIDYIAAFYNLWSEVDFWYQPHRKVYLSNRLPRNLDRLGAKLLVQLCESPRQAQERLSALEDHEPVILGMDAFYVPWSQFYKVFHGPHFFIARQEKGHVLPCFDPTFDKADVYLPRADIIAHAYDISRLTPVAAEDLAGDPLSDAAEISRRHPLAGAQGSEQLERLLSCDSEEIVQLAKFVDALQLNRTLYRLCLERQSPGSEKHLLLKPDLHLRWTALKNGLYKAAVQKEGSVVRDIQKLFTALIEEERDLARRLH